MLAKRAALLGTVVIASCAPPTQLLVFVENSDRPEAIYDEVTVEALAPGMTATEAGQASLGALAVPMSFAVVPTVGTEIERAVEVRVRAHEATGWRERVVQTRFRSERRVVVTVDLSELCDAHVCGVGQTCRAGRCESVEGDGECTPGCEDGELVVCAADGARRSFVCPLGCAAGSPSRCAPLASDHVPASAMAGAPEIVIASGSTCTINTTTLVLRAPAQPELERLTLSVAGDDVAVVRVASLVVESGAVIRVVGSRSLAIVAERTIDVRGTIDVTANGSEPGPGGGFGGAQAMAAPGPRGGSGGNDSGNSETGGGGGGNGGVGGAGGPADTVLGAAGGPRASTSDLRGGGGGGGGADASTGPGAAGGGIGGGGGGGLLLAAAISIEVTGAVDAAGSGGTGDDEGGGGGGAGGTIVLEAPEISVAGSVTANGGGGAAPGAESPPGGPIVDGAPGQLGTRTRASAHGGVGAEGGAGGDGGAGAQLDGRAGSEGGDGFYNVQSGGGGGAAGRIDLTHVAPVTVTGVISPDPRMVAGRPL